jgi:hypothetical protein
MLRDAEEPGNSEVSSFGIGKCPWVIQERVPVVKVCINYTPKTINPKQKPSATYFIAEGYVRH